MVDNYNMINTCIDGVDEHTDIYLATGNPLPNEGTEFMKKLYGTLINKKVFSFKSVRSDYTKRNTLTKRGFTFHPSRQGKEFFKDENRYSFKVEGYDKRKVHILQKS